MEYKPVYKCRMCGKVYKSAVSTGEKMARRCMIELTCGVRGTVAMAPTMTETHDCGGDHTGSLGLADFQGWEAVPDE